MKDAKKNHPDLRVVVISIGVNPNGTKYTFETVGENDRDPAADVSGNVPGQNGVPTQNNPNGPATIGDDYDGDEIADDINNGGGPPTECSTDAGQYICDSTTYHLHTLDADGEIDTGIFIHVPPATPKSELFAQLLIESLFYHEDQPFEDFDGDGIANGADSFPTDPTMN